MINSYRDPYDTGVPEEIFLRMAKEGNTLSGLMEAFATCVSVALQYGFHWKLYAPSSNTCALSRVGIRQTVIFRWPRRSYTICFGICLKPLLKRMEVGITSRGKYLYDNTVN